MAAGTGEAGSGIPSGENLSPQDDPPQPLPPRDPQSRHFVAVKKLRLVGIYLFVNKVLVSIGKFFLDCVAAKLPPCPPGEDVGTLGGFLAVVSPGACRPVPPCPPSTACSAGSAWNREGALHVGKWQKMESIPLFFKPVGVLGKKKKYLQKVHLH